MPRSAAQLDFSPKQARQFTADCQTKPGASVLATGTGIGLLEGLEDDALFFEGNADTGIRNLERNNRSRLAENRMILAPAALRRRYRQANPSTFGKLESVREKILQHLL